jgi:mannose-6-phosphate isomerase-like protein (cupin superfamily)
MFRKSLRRQKMINQRKDMKTESREKMRGGEGSVEFVHFVNCENEKNIRMLAEITLQPGCSVGNHSHDTETEYYIFLSGNGTVNDNGETKTVKAGDVMITGNGASHSVSNTGDVPLMFHAIIVTY